MWRKQGAGQEKTLVDCLNTDKKSLKCRQGDYLPNWTRNIQELVEINHCHLDNESAWRSAFPKQIGPSADFPGRCFLRAPPESDHASLSPCVYRNSLPAT